MSVIEWATGSEENFSHFDIQKTYDGMMFETIGSVSSKGDNSNYSFEDASKGEVYYRIKMVDLNGDIKYSDINTCTKCEPNSHYLSNNLCCPFRYFNTGSKCE